MNANGCMTVTGTYQNGWTVFFHGLPGLFGDFYCLEPGRILFCAQVKIKYDTI